MIPVQSRKSQDSADGRSPDERYIVRALPVQKMPHGGFDRLAAKAVVEAKKIDPEVTLALLLLYHPENRPMVPPKGFDGHVLPSRYGACATPCSPRQGEPLYG